MILGIGVDIVKLQRIEKSLLKFPLRFATKILTADELERFKSLEVKNKSAATSFVAKRFAVKEAFSKALGTGMSEGVSFSQIGVINNEKGAPSLEISGAAKVKADSLGVNQMHLSISDEQDAAVAFVVLES